MKYRGVEGKLKELEFLKDNAEYLHTSQLNILTSAHIKIKELELRMRLLLSAFNIFDDDEIEIEILTENDFYIIYSNGLIVEKYRTLNEAEYCRIFNDRLMSDELMATILEKLYSHMIERGRQARYDYSTMMKMIDARVSIINDISCIESACRIISEKITDYALEAHRKISYSDVLPLYDIDDEEDGECSACLTLEVSLWEGGMSMIVFHDYAEEMRDEDDEYLLTEYLLYEGLQDESFLSDPKLLEGIRDIPSKLIDYFKELFNV